MTRSAAAVFFVLVATLVAPLAIAASWFTTHVDDREEYVDTVAPLAEDPEVQQLMADAAATAATTALQERIPVGLPGAIQDWARAAAAEVVESPDFPQFWSAANADLHDDVMRLVDDPAARADGYVTVDASPLLGQVLLSLEERGIPVGLLPDVPLDVRVVPESRLVEVSDSYRAADAAARWLPVIWGGLVLLAVLVAAGWRGRVRAAGWALVGVALAAGVVLLAVDPLTELAADEAGAGREELVGQMLEIVLASLTPFAQRLLLAAPAGLVLLAVTLWPRRRHDSGDFSAREVQESLGSRP